MIYLAFGGERKGSGLEIWGDCTIVNAAFKRR